MSPIKPLIMLAFLGAAAAAAIEEPSMKQLNLENLVFFYGPVIEPEGFMRIVSDLEENIYQKVDVERQGDQKVWMRQVVKMLYNLGKADKETCKDLAAYNESVDQWRPQLVGSLSILNAMDVYQARLNKLCQ